jgi:hypothetical protein
MKTNSESDRFEAAMKQILSVSHEELQQREKAWKKEKRAKKRAKASPASRAADVKG